MADWDESELTAFETTDEMEIETMRADGSYRKPVIIWMVRVDNDLYARAVHSVTSKWYRHATEQHRAKISASGIYKEVSLAEVDDEDLNERINKAYQTKYNRYAANIVESTQTADAKQATLKLTPIE